MATRAFLGAATLAAVAAAATLAASDAAAQSQRTFVSPYGSDANTCALAVPCRTFARAITQTLANGEIVALESGGFGSVDIPQSVSIIAPDGVYAGVTVAAAPGYGVQIVGSNLRVVLRNLQINGQGGATGVLIPAGSANNEVYLERVTLSNLSTAGVRVVAAAKVSVKESIFRENTEGIVVEPTAGGAELAVDSTLFERNQNGIDVYPNVSLAVTRSGFTANSVAGIFPGNAGVVQTLAVADCSFVGNVAGINMFASTNVQATIRNSTLAGNGTGVRANTGVTYILDGNTIAGNTTGVNVSTGVVRAAGTNAIRGNTTDVSGALTGVGTL
jgi:hypothetical protein